jgi:hypothetical protein
MCDAACAEQGAVWALFEPDAPLAERTDQLAREKYSQPRYNQKR